LQTEESISGLAAMVKELQEYFTEDKKRGLILTQQDNERKEQHWNGDISQINKVTTSSWRDDLSSPDNKRKQEFVNNYDSQWSMEW